MPNRGFEITLEDVEYCDLCTSIGQETTTKCVGVAVTSSQQIITLFICKDHLEKLLGEVKDEEKN